MLNTTMKSWHQSPYQVQFNYWPSLKAQYSTLLETGSGRGYFLDYLLKEPNSKCSIICSDISENEIESASKNTKALLEEKRKSIPIEVIFKVCPCEKPADICSDIIDTYVST